MIKHYIKIAFRNLAQQKVLTGINISGLSIGIACFSLFLLYAVHEFSYDRFHQNADRLYRVVEWWEGKDRAPGGSGSVCTPVGPALKKDFPDVEYAVRMKGNGCLARIKDNIFHTSITFADKDFFDIFSFPLLYGNTQTALQDPRHIVLTKENALQLFGTTNVVGKTLELKTDSAFEPFTISGVAENIPANSSVNFNILCNFEHIANTPMVQGSNNDWNMTIGLGAFVQLKQGSRLASEHKRLALFRQKYLPNEKQDDVQASFRLQPIRDIHMNPQIEGGANPGNSWILITIAAAVLIIACINFTTLAIGRSAGRAKEIGVRKVMGSQRKQLIGQFLAESFVLSVLSAVIGLLLTYVLLPLFNQLADRQLSFSFSRFPELIWLLTGLTVLVGLLAGSYPALVLSAFKPVEVLKRKVRVGGSNLFTRSLVTLQFVLSIGLIVSTIIILQQIAFIRSKNIGFNKENIVMINTGRVDSKKIYPLYKQVIESNTGILSITAGEMGLGAGEGQMGRGYKNHMGEKTAIIEYPGDYNFLNTMGMQLIAGRNFNPSLASDSINAVIVNEAVVQDVLGTTIQNALGRQLFGAKDSSNPKTIIGVSRNFNFEDLTHKVRPQLFYRPSNLEPSRLFVLLQAGDPATKLTLLSNTWKKLVPDAPFEYSFMDEKFDNFYKSEERWSAIVGWAGGISIFLACLGLFGLAALAAVNRTKEFGIRKVMGATVTQMAALLSKDFIKLIAVALVIAAPLAWYFMNDWLQAYAWRINITWWVFALTGLFTMLVAVTTVSFQAVKAALANPVKSLKNE
ncbi:FtsX-like permease family protein [Niastella caeni]|uniref:FtsX-like permease family protein n=1 Tax=Niastella caeni TaxID=2569763 RepID=A0A4S8HIA8_9BACT|nr:ABC transporter permease [Niastella caeni]THU34847.1 FtsX-like permease family protein [Niastella caeni]